MAVTPGCRQSNLAKRSIPVQHTLNALLLGALLTGLAGCAATGQGAGAEADEPGSGVQAKGAGGASAGKADKAAGRKNAGKAKGDKEAKGKEGKDGAGKAPTFDGIEPHITRAGEDEFGNYFSMVTKITYDIDGDKLVRLGYDEADAPAERAEDLFQKDVEGDAAYRCTDRGASWNQSTMWYPYTAVLVRGGSLTGVTQAHGARRATVAFDGVSELGELWVKREAKPYTFAGCVGEHEVKTGHRTQTGFVQNGDRLSVQLPGRKQVLQLRLPADPQVYGLLEFEDEQVAVAPARIVLATVDLPRKRVVLQYQFTVAASKGLTEVSLLESLSSEDLKLLASDPPEDFKELKGLNQVMQAHLRSCKPVTSPLSDACLKPSAQLKRRLEAVIE